MHVRHLLPPTLSPNIDWKLIFRLHQYSSDWVNAQKCVCSPHMLIMHVIKSLLVFSPLRGNSCIRCYTVMNAFHPLLISIRNTHTLSLSLGVTRWIIEPCTANYHGPANDANYQDNYQMSCYALCSGIIPL